MSPAQDIAVLIGYAELGVVGQNVFIGTQPEAPVACTTIYDTGSGEVDTDELDMHTPSFQVRVRSATYAAGYDLAKSIQDALGAITGARVHRRLWTHFALTSGVAMLGRDEKDRFQFVASYRSTYFDLPELTAAQEAIGGEVALALDFTDEYYSDHPGSVSINYSLLP